MFSKEKKNPTFGFSSSYFSNADPAGGCRVMKTRAIPITFLSLSLFLFLPRHHHPDPSKDLNFHTP